MRRRRLSVGAASHKSSSQIKRLLIVVISALGPREERALGELEVDALLGRPALHRHHVLGRVRLRAPAPRHSTPFPFPSPLLLG